MCCLEPKCITWAWHSNNESSHSLHATPAIIVAVTRGKRQRMRVKAVDSFAFALYHMHWACVYGGRSTGLWPFTLIRPQSQQSYVDVNIIRDNASK